MTLINLIILPVLPTISKSSRPSSKIERKKGMRAKKSMRFIIPKKNLNFLGHTMSLIMYSKKKKMTTKYSMMSMKRMMYSQIMKSGSPATLMIFNWGKISVYTMLNAFQSPCLMHL